MEVFLNEKSLHSQFHSDQDFRNAAIEIMSIYKTIQKVDNNAFNFDGNNLFQSIAICGTNLHGSLKKAGKEVSENFYLMVYQKTPVFFDWRKNQQHLTHDSFLHGIEDVTDTCLAEVCERSLKMNDKTFLILNFNLSKYSALSNINVTKNTTHSTSTLCFDSDAALNKWIKTNFPHLTSYNTNSLSSPRDFETILVDEALFTIHPRLRNQNRRVYVQNSTGNLWVVDRASVGRNAHLEVFKSSDNSHIGISDINAIHIDTSKMVRGRSLSNN